MPAVIQNKHTVPYVRFHRNNDGGFTVKFRCLSRMYYYIAIFGSVLFPIGILLLYSGVSHSLGVLSIVISIFTLSWPFLLSPTTIIASREAILIDNKRILRQDFREFQVYEPQECGVNKDAQRRKPHSLGYAYAQRTYPVGGAWMSEQQVAEVARALNAALSSVPREANPNTVSPDVSVDPRRT